MRQNQPKNTNPQEESIQIPLNMEPSSTTLINSKGRNKKWLMIIICVLFVITGESISRVLQNFYYYQIKKVNNNKHEGTWTQSLLQFIGFPLLLIPFFKFPSKNHNQLPITSDRTSLKYLAILYPCTAILMAAHAKLSNKGMLDIPYLFYILFYTTQLLFTPVFSSIVHGTKFNPWMITSLFFAIAAGSLSCNSSFAGEYREDDKDFPGSMSALFAAATFAFLLCNIQNILENVISKRNETTNRKRSFSAVLELLIFSSLLATVISLVALFIFSEQHVLKREIYLFPKGKTVYVITMLGQAIGWQIYWVGIVGLVFAVSSIFSNVISVCTWSITSVLVFLFIDGYFGAVLIAALVAAPISTATYFYRIYKEKSDNDD